MFYKISMFRRISVALITVALFTWALTAPAIAGEKKPVKAHPAIVLAGFGTTYPSALESILNIQERVQKAFPGVKVKMAFTSNIIRRIWHKRQGDEKFFAENKNIPEEIVYVKGPLATIADLQDSGYRTIVVQPTHIYAGEEYTDLCAYIHGLNQIKTVKKKFMPFDKLVVGRPALGKWGVEYDYHADMETAARALSGDVDLAMKNDAALVYMGHGNEFYSTGIYAEFQQVMRHTYPDAKIFIGTVEGYPSFDNVAAALSHSGIKKIVLKPMMIVAGDHANNDMAGDDADSWKRRLVRAGIEVLPVLKGLGSNDAFAGIFIDHIKNVAHDAGIDLSAE